ncbi:MAG: periplasmic heavy metal sensor [Candidatus Solibacter usitatus]|nr:periplasmic heavy metal sensor [Candidatus Solibacter usitatus]
MSKLALILLFLGLPVLAQPPRGFFPWWDSPLARDLNLSEDQSRQIRNIVKEYRTRLIDLRAGVEKAETELEDQYGEDLFDQRRATESIERLVTARGELTRALSLMSLRLRGVLTTEQYRELQKRRPNMRPGQGMRQMQQRRQGQQPPPGEQPPPPHRER